MFERVSGGDVAMDGVVGHDGKGRGRDRPEGHTGRIGETGPKMVTDVSPAAGPETGEISVMDVVIGAETALGWVTTKESESLAPVVDVTWALICCGGGVDVMHGWGRQVRHCRDAHRVAARDRIVTGDGVVRARGWRTARRLGLVASVI